MSDLLDQIHHARSRSLSLGLAGRVRVEALITPDAASGMTPWTPSPDAVALHTWSTWARPCGIDALQITKLTWASDATYELRTTVVSGSEASAYHLQRIRTNPLRTVGSSVHVVPVEHDHPAVRYHNAVLEETTALRAHLASQGVDNPACFPEVMRRADGRHHAAVILLPDATGSMVADVAFAMAEAARYVNDGAELAVVPVDYGASACTVFSAALTELGFAEDRYEDSAPF